MYTIAVGGAAVNTGPGFTHGLDYGMSIKPPPPVMPATGVRRLLYIVLGLLFVVMAYIGAIMPGIPTTPFVLLASYFFSRSSPRLSRWLKRTPYFGHMLHDWETHRGLRRSIKITASCIIVPVVSASIIFTPLPTWVKITIGCLAGIGLCVIWLVLPTVRQKGEGLVAREDI